MSITRKLLVIFITRWTGILSNIFVLYLIFFKSKSLRKYENLSTQQNKLSIEMSPYGSYDCILQYVFLAVIFSKLGFSVRLRLPESRTLLSVNKILLSSLIGIQMDRRFKIKDHLKLSTGSINRKSILNHAKQFSDQVMLITSLLEDKPKLALSAIDSFVRTCNVNQFFGEECLDSDLFSDIINLSHEIENSEFYQEYSFGSHSFIPDSAYLNMGTYKHICELTGAKINILNPNGMLTRLDKGEFEYSISQKQLDDILNGRYGECLAEAKLYQEVRMSGRGLDSDSKRAFANSVSKSSSEFQARKVLFLHAIRDANNLCSPKPSLFNTYFEWSDFMINAISKGNPEDWYIKIHPSSSLYLNDEEIISRLCAKYGLERKLSESIPPTRYILESRMPVFTHSGTIALETASVGYKSFVIGSRYPESMVRKVKDYDELLCLINELSLASLVELTSSRISDAALLISYKHFAERLAWPISPTKPVSPSLDPLVFSINSFSSVISLITRLMKKDALDLSLKIAYDFCEINDSTLEC